MKKTILYLSVCLCINLQDISWLRLSLLDYLISMSKILRYIQAQECNDLEILVKTISLPIFHLSGKAIYNIGIFYTKSYFSVRFKLYLGKSKLIVFFFTFCTIDVHCTHTGHENCRPSFFHHWIP